MQGSLGSTVNWTVRLRPPQTQGPLRGAGTIESVDGLLPEAPSDAPVDPLILVALILQEVLQEVQHLSHLQNTWIHEWLLPTQDPTMDKRTPE